MHLLPPMVVSGCYLVFISFFLLFNSTFDINLLLDLEIFLILRDSWDLAGGFPQSNHILTVCQCPGMEKRRQLEYPAQIYFKFTTDFSWLSRQGHSGEIGSSSRGVS
jgi:hypothetical protein